MNNKTMMNFPNNEADIKKNDLLLKHKIQITRN